MCCDVEISFPLLEKKLQNKLINKSECVVRYVANKILKLDCVSARFLFQPVTRLNFNKQSFLID